MSDAQREYRFIIGAYSPDTLPMSRLAEYMADLARLLGEVERVHFACLERGSTTLVQVVEPEAVPEVQQRIHGDWSSCFTNYKAGQALEGVRREAVGRCP